MKDPQVLIGEKGQTLIEVEKLLKIIREWKFGWMNQRQNSQADYENYFNRAFGVDANMIHSLAKQIVDKFNNQPQPEEK